MTASAALLLVGLGLAFRDLKSWFLAPIWLSAQLCWVAGWCPPLRLPHLTRRQALAAAALLVVAAAARLFRLADLQPLQVDELTVAQVVVRRAWASWEHPTAPFLLFAVNQSDTDGQLLFGAYRRLAFLLVGGVNLTTLRLPSALVGTAEVALVFFLGRMLFGFRAGLVAAAVLATLAVHLTFSRHGLDNVEASLVWTSVAFCLTVALTRRAPAPLALGGLVLGLALYFYPAARPVLALAATTLAVAAIDPRTRGRWMLWGLGALLGGFTVGAGPLLVAYYRDPLTFVYYAGHKLWFGEALDAFRASGDVKALMPIWEHLTAAVLAYSIVPSADNRYWPGRALFVAFPAVLLYAGVAWALSHLLDWRFRLLAFWFWGATLALSFLSDPTPAVHRLLPVLPACALLIGAAWEGLVRVARRFGRLPSHAVVGVATLALAASLAQEAAFYFGDYAQRELAPRLDGFVRRVLAAPDGQRLGVLSPVEHGFEVAFTTSDGRRNSSVKIARVADYLPENAPSPKGVLYMVHEEWAPWLSLLRDIYPFAREEPVTRGASANPAWTAIEVDEASIEERRGLQLRVVDAAGILTESRSAGVELPAELDLSMATYPLALEWRGWLRRSDVPAVGKMSVRGADARLWLGETAIDVSQRAGMTLPPGTVPLRATLRVSSPTIGAGILWEEGDRGPSAFGVDRTFAWPAEPRVIVDALSADGSELLAREYDVAIADWSIGLRGPARAALLRYSARFQQEQDGSIPFELKADGPVRMLVDGRQVWPAGGAPPAPAGGAQERNRIRVTLAAGEHDVTVERLRTEGRHVALLWWRGVEPGRIVPPSALLPVAWP